MERAADPTIPDELSKRYDRFERLGSGTSGVVYRAHDIVLDTDVSIKVLKHQQLTAERIVRFQNEARVASKLKHKNLVAIMNFGVAKGEPYLVMEYVSGRSLEVILEERGAIPVLSALNIAVQICEGMEHAHSQGVIHRDLKPSNCVVDGDDLDFASVKVLDFGIAKLDSEDSEALALTRTGSFVGTPYYMSPEQFEADGHADVTSDIYATGVILFRMLSGRLPFESETVFEIKEEKMNKRAPRICDTTDDTDAHELDRIVSRCLETDPHHRYQSMTLLKEALTAAAMEIKARTLVLEPIRVDDEKHRVVPSGIDVIPLAVEKESKFARLRKPLIVYGIGILLTMCAFTIAQAMFVSLYPIKKAEFETDNADLQRIEHGELTAGELTIVRTVFKIDKRDRSNWHATSKVDDRAVMLLLNHSLKDIRRIDFRVEDGVAKQEDISDKSCIFLRRLPLRWLGMATTNITDEGLKELAEIQSLNYLDLTDTKISDAGLRYIEALPIDTLYLNNTAVTDAGIPSLLKMKRLQRIFLTGTHITDKALQALGAKPLERLAIGDGEVSDKGLEEFGRKNHSLKWLDVDRVRAITSTGIRSIRHLPLRQLFLTDCKGIDDETAAEIAEYWPNLDALGLSGTRLSGKGVKAIEKMSSLRSLELATLLLGDDSLKPVLSFHNLRYLDLRENKMTDRLALQLANLSQLKKLELSHNVMISPQAIASLKKKLHDVVAVDNYSGPTVDQNDLNYVMGTPESVTDPP